MISLVTHCHTLWFDLHVCQVMIELFSTKWQWGVIDQCINDIIQSQAKIWISCGKLYGKLCELVSHFLYTTFDLALAFKFLII